jgi:TolA-binding protein
LTRKSPPAASWFDNTVNSLVVVFLTICVSGCTTFTQGFFPGKSSLTDYEEARRSIENPVNVTDDDSEVYQPEGVSAERAKGKTDILQRLGLTKARRKDISVARSQYEAAEKQLDIAKTAESAERAKAFRQAAEQYMLAADNWKSSGLEQNALFMAAECLFFAEDYFEAEETYAKLIKEYPRNPYLDRVDSRRFEIADYWLQVDDTAHKPFLLVNLTDNKLPWNDTGGHGKRVLEKMRIDNPTGKVSDDATMRLAVNQYKKGDFEGAADTFADLRMTYPDSEHLFNAQMLELESLLNSYQGVHYSSLPLTDAEKRVKQIVRQFPTEANERQQDLNQAYAQIQFLRAEREWYNAQFRQSKQENDSARFYYNKILEEFPETPFAEKAEQRLAELKDAPDAPPNYLAPLAKLMGADDDKRPYVIENGGN